MSSYTEMILAIWNKYALSSLELKQRQETDELTVVAKLESEPHIYLHHLITNAETLLNRKDPTIEQTIEYLLTLSKTLPLGDERNKVHIMHKWLLSSFQTYETLIQTYAFSTYFAANELLFPGYYKRWIAKVTFGSALTSQMFVKGVQKTLDPRLYLIRATQRLLNGYSTQPQTSKIYKLNDTFSKCVMTEEVFLKNKSIINLIKTTLTNEKQDLLKLTSRAKIDTCSALTEGEKITKKYHNLENVLRNSICTLHTSKSSSEERIKESISQLKKGWKEFLSLSPSPKEFQSRLFEQEQELNSLICNLLKKDADFESCVRAAWADSIFQTDLSSKLTIYLATSLTASTKAGYKTCLDCTDVYFKDSVTNFTHDTEITYLLSKLQSLLYEGQEIYQLSYDNIAEDSRVLWTDTAEIAIKLDVACIFKSFCAILSKTKAEDRVKFVEEQIQRNELHESLCIATNAITFMKSEIEAAATTYLFDIMHKPMLKSSVALQKQLNTICIAVLKTRAKATSDSNNACMNSIQGNHELITLQITSLSYISVHADCFTALREIWTEIGKRGDLIKNIDVNDILYHYNNGMQECDKILKTGINLHHVAEICSVLEGAANLLWFAQIKAVKE